MDLLEYQELAITTKIYDDSIALPYIVLGICGESSELYEKIVESVMKPGFDQSLLRKEIGDVAWYLAGWAEENGLQIQTIYQMCDISGQSKLSQLNDGLIVYSGRIAELTKKALRDDFESVSKGVFPEDKLKKVNVAVANLLFTIVSISTYFGFNFMEILQENVDKLASRAKRGVLAGSGDTR